MDRILATSLAFRPTFVRWLLAIGAVVCLLALVDGVRVSWNAAPSGPRSVAVDHASAPPTVASAPSVGSGSGVMESGRTPIPVLVERAHVRCARDGRVPIVIMERCHHGMSPPLRPADDAT